MLPVRVAFDPALPVMASQTLTIGGRTFEADKPFPWRDIGIDEAQLTSFWRSGLVYFVMAPIPVASPPPVKQARPARR